MTALGQCKRTKWSSSKTHRWLVHSPDSDQVRRRGRLKSVNGSNNIMISDSRCELISLDLSRHPVSLHAVSFFLPGTESMTDHFLQSGHLCCVLSTPTIALLHLIVLQILTLVLTLIRILMVTKPQSAYFLLSQPHQVIIAHPLFRPELDL